VWEADPPEVASGLRQGDLLLQLPVAKQQTGEALEATITLDVETKDFVVVGQCCTVQNNKVVALAPLQTMREDKQGAELLAGLRLRPPVPRGVTLPVNYFLLENHSSLAVPDGRLKVVSLLGARIVHAGPDPMWLQRRRVARMTVRGRRDLRSRLLLHWARPTDDDEAYLALVDEPVFLPAHPPVSYADDLRDETAEADEPI